MEGLGQRRKAECWRFFKVKVDPGSNDKVLELMCKTCGPDVQIAYSGNTSNLRSHLSHLHKDLFCQLVSNEGTDSAADEHTSETPKPGTLEAILPPVSAARRDELHKKVQIYFFVCYSCIDRYLHVFDIPFLFVLSFVRF